MVLPADQKSRARAYSMHVVPCARKALTPVPGCPVLLQDDRADDSPADDSPADGTSR